MHLDYDAPTTLRLIADHLRHVADHWADPEDLDCPLELVLLQGDLDDLGQVLEIAKRDFPPDADDNQDDDDGA